jgi:tRNA 2-thiouridine synthesizing protein A
MAETTMLDLRGVRCPLPIVRLNTHIKTLSPGDAVAFIADDPAFELDVKAWARRTGHTLSLTECGPDGIRGAITRVA